MNDTSWKVGKYTSALLLLLPSLLREREKKTERQQRRCKVQRSRICTGKTIHAVCSLDLTNQCAHKNAINHQFIITIKLQSKHIYNAMQKMKMEKTKTKQNGTL